MVSRHWLGIRRPANRWPAYRRRILATALPVLALGTLAWTAVTSGCRSMVFHPGPNDAALREQYDARRFTLPSHGETIEGWWIENPISAAPAASTAGARSETVVLYFGGNAEDVLYTAVSAAKLDARAVVFMNYRGYGESTGKANDKALYADGIAAYEYVVSKGVRPDNLVVMGRSLGSGVASMLAASRPVKGAVLVTPYDSISAVTADRFPKVAVSLLIGNSFLPSVEWARKAQAPALLLAAERDDLIPPKHAQQLSQAWAARSEMHVLPGVGHNDVSRNPDYYRLINRFLASPAAAVSAATAQ